MTKDTIGCDISKDRIDAFRLSDRTYVQVPNNGAGYEDLLAWFGQDALARVVYEPTGAYHRAFEEALAGRAPLCKVNPLHARRFAQASGVRAKTDKVDAQVLARMGIALQLEPDPIVGRDTHLLNELQTVRRALIKDRGRARNQLGTQREALSRRLTTARLKLIEAQIAEVDAAIRARLLSCPRRSQALACIESIKGIGTVVAQAILTDMPEIGTLSTKAAASLAGLAPITRQSGKWRTFRHRRWPKTSARRALHARPRRQSAQSRHARSLHPYGRSGQTCQSRADSNHAKTHHSGEHLGQRKPRMDTKLTLRPKTDTLPSVEREKRCVMPQGKIETL